MIKWREVNKVTKVNWICWVVCMFTDRPHLLSKLQRSPADTSLRPYSWLCGSDSPMNTTTPRPKNTGMHVEQRLARPSPLLQSLMNSQKCSLLENLLFQTGGETESTTALLIRIQLRVASKTGSSQQLAWLTGVALRLLWKRKEWFPLMLKSHLWPTTKTRPSKGDPPNLHHAHINWSKADICYFKLTNAEVADTFHPNQLIPAQAFISFALLSICHHWSLLYVIYNDAEGLIHLNTRLHH